MDTTSSDLERTRAIVEERSSFRADLVDELETIAGSHAEEEAQRLELEEMQRAELAAELEQQDRENATTAARDTLAAVDELADLRELANAVPSIIAIETDRRRRTVERLEAGGRTRDHARALAVARMRLAEAEHALELARRWSPLRRAILAKVLPNG